MNQHHIETVATIGKGIFGLSVISTGVITSFQVQVEWALRVTSLAIGIAVGVATLWSILRKSKRDRDG